jgi:hypothetical protein
MPGGKQDQETQPQSPAANPADAASYIASLAGELRDMARRADLGFLAYLLAMVEDEAATTATARSRGGKI